MGIKRIVDTSFWTDGKVDEFTPEDRYFMLYLLTNPFTKQLGIYEISIKQVAFQLGYSVDSVKILLERFENKYGMIVFSSDTNEVAILNFLRHSVVRGGKPVADCIIQDMTRVKNRKLIDIVFSHIKDKDDLTPTVKKIVSDYFNDKDKDIDNDIYNDNDNDSTGHVTSPVTVGVTASVTQNKHPRGEYKNVFLTDEEEEKLIDEFGIEFALRAIRFLDEYIEEKQYKSDSHYLTIKRWVIDAAREKEAKDIKDGKVQPTRYGDFDVHEAFKLALERSYGNKDEEETEQSEELKQRMEALKERIGQDA